MIERGGENVMDVPQTFEEWERQQDPAQPADEGAAWNAGRMSRDKAITKLVKALRESSASIHSTHGHHPFEECIFVICLNNRDALDELERPRAKEEQS